MKINKNRSVNLLIIFSFFILSFLFVFPLAKTRTIFFGDDMYYHLQRILEMTKNFQQHNYFIGMYTYTFQRIGYPLNLFYPWITLIPFVVFNMLFNNLSISTYAGIILYTFLTLFFTFLTTLKFSKNRIQSYFTAILYTFCAYRTINAFARFALGEFLALTFLPLCSYGLYAILKGKYSDWPYLAFGMSFVLLSHILSTFIYCIYLFILLIVCVVSHIDNIQERLLSLLKSIAVAFLSSLIFLGPFLEQQLYQRFNQPSKMDMAAEALIPTKLLASSLNNNFQRVAQGNTYNLGIVLLVIIGVAVFQYETWKTPYKVTFILSILFIFVSTSLFPWTIGSKTPLSLIQFPWRFLGIASYLLSIIGGKEIVCCLGQHTLSLKKAIFTVGIVSLAIIIPWSSSMLSISKIASGEKTKNYNFITLNNNTFIFSKSAKSFIIQLFYLDQYTPSKGESSLKSTVLKHKVTTNDNRKMIIKHISYSPNTISFKSNKLSNLNKVELPIYAYKNIYVISHHHVLPTEISNTNQLIVNNKGKSRLDAVYMPSRIDILSEVISVCTWVIFLIVLVYKSVKPNHNKSLV